MSHMNRLANMTNPYQGTTKKVLCVCSAGLLRSPTAAVVLSAPPFNFNTRTAGVSEEFALIPVDEVLIQWADEVVCMEQWQADKLERLYGDKCPPLFTLDIEDSYGYRDPKLMALIAEAYTELSKAAMQVIHHNKETPT